MPWDDGLTAEQRTAASHVGRHARLLAGPGTGKTLTLTRRVAYLVRERCVAPSEIMVLTFTRAATAELKRRIADQLGEDANRAIISTLHSYALRAILQQGAGQRLPVPIRIADDFEERNIIEEDLKDILNLPRVTAARELLNRLSADWERLAADAAGYRFPNPAFYGAWQEHRQVFGYTLRAELVYQLRHALEEGAVTPAPPRYIVVDEYQDLNPCDLAVVKKLTELGAELYVAGDDDQSIYGFRYAEPEGIRRFNADYTPATSLALETCQRCGSRILDLASYVAAQDPRRVPKTVTPAARASPGEVRILNFRNQHEEAEAVARICRWLVTTQALTPDDILILLRSDRHNAFSAPLRAALEQQGLLVSTVLDPLEPLNNREGRQFLSILRLAVNPNDHLAWRTLLWLRRNSIGDRALKALYDLAHARGAGFAEAATAAAGDVTLLPRFGQALAREVEAIRRTIDEARTTIEAKDLTDAIDELAVRHIGDAAVRQSVVELFRRVIGAASPQDVEELLRALNVSLGDAEQERQSGAINIMTMHQAKGLTAGAVVIVAAEDEYIPGRADGPAIDDERRLLYVSLTRARRYLYVTHCRQRTGQQAHTGRNPGTRRRTLTRFLSGGPVPSENGSAFLSGLAGGGRG